MCGINRRAGQKDMIRFFPHFVKGHHTTSLLLRAHIRNILSKREKHMSVFNFDISAVVSLILDIFTSKKLISSSGGGGCYFSRKNE